MFDQIHWKTNETWSSQTFAKALLNKWRTQSYNHKASCKRQLVS
jgi:hypothetical protein